MFTDFFKKTFPFNLSYRDFIFIPVFFAFYITQKVFGNVDFIVQNFTGRSISFATSEGIDIASRVSAFYKAIAFLLILILLFTRITILLKTLVTEVELKIANGLSLAGFCLLFFHLLGADMKPSLHILFACFIICLAGFIYHQIKKRDNRDFLLIFLWSVLVASSVYFFLWQITVFAGVKRIFSLPSTIIILGTPLYIWFTGHYEFTNKWIRCTQPLVYLPLLSFFSMELFMILNQHGMNTFPSVIYVAGLTLIWLKGFLNYRNKSGYSTTSLDVNRLFRQWIPWLLAGMCCLAFYMPVVQPDVDWYESANNVLPLHQWFAFGKMPFLDIYSSHALSDFGAGLLYALFNGPDPMGNFVYRFIISVLVTVLVYFFMRKITGDGFLALWTVLAYPYYDFLIPSYYNIVPLAALALVMLHKKQSTGRYVFFFASLLFMPLWRIDLGLSTLIAGFSCLLILIVFVPSFKIEKRNLLKGLGINILVIALLFIAALIHSGSHLFVSLKDALGYMSSFQSYGIKDLSYTHDMKYYSLYFLMPAVVVLIIIHTVYSLIRNQNDSDQKRVFGIAIVFLGIFYISNLQRGLVRHTLAEMWDTALTSYGYFVISAFVLLKYIDKNPFVRFLMFFIASTIIVSNYVLSTPDLKTNNLYSLVTNRLKDIPPITHSTQKIKRIIENPEYKFRYDEFSLWMNKNFPGKSSYIDFSNTPMLYYYSNRELPNYLTQIPQTAHNDYLQDRFLEDLKNYDLPVTVFSNVPQTFWDNLDGIPNTLRHYKISEYIYRKYKPSLILNNHCIWIDKKIASAKEKEFMSVSTGDMSLSSLTSTGTNTFQTNGTEGSLEYSFNTPLSHDGKKISVAFRVTANRSCDLTFLYRPSSGSFDDTHKIVYPLNEGENELFFLVEQKEHEGDVAGIRIKLASDAIYAFSPIRIFYSEHYPDLISYRTADQNLKWIPYIWGAYDKNYLSGNIGNEKNILQQTRLFEADKATKIPFAPVADKENGNYIALSARVPSGNSATLVMAYGEENSRNGAFIFNLKDDTLYHDYVVRISSQYRWYTRNNSWLNLFPVGSKIEIKRISILKGD